MATALVKETVTKYISEGSTVYAGFVNLSKAFKRVPHDKLLLKLKKKNVPDFIVNILSVMFMNTSVSVRYGNDFSRKWKLLRGIRQGGVLSAYLFFIYLDDILETIGNLGIGCKLGINFINVQAYADYIFFISTHYKWAVVTARAPNHFSARYKLKLFIRILMSFDVKKVQ